MTSVDLDGIPNRASKKEDQIAHEFEDQLIRSLNLLERQSGRYFTDWFRCHGCVSRYEQQLQEWKKQRNEFDKSGTWQY